MTLSLRLLGGASLEQVDGPVRGPAAQRHRLALLALLAAARGEGVARERLAALLWPERDTEHTRNSLKQAVHVLRRTLGATAIVSAGDDLRLDVSVVAVDVLAFEAAVAAGDADAAVAAYRGPYLDGFYLRDAEDFERWMEGERARLRALFHAQLERLAVRADAAGETLAAVTHWRRLAAEQPTSARAALGLMRALVAAGDRGEAIRHARVHTVLLREEYGSEPDAEVLALAERLREGGPTVATASDAGPRAPASVPAPPADADVRDAASVPPPTEASVALPPASRVAPVSRAARAWPRAPLLAAALALVALLTVAVGARRGAAPARAQALAVLPFVDLGASREDAYFGDGLTEELIHALSNAGPLRVTARTSAFAFRGRALDVRDVGRRLGVDLIVEGSVRREGQRVRITAQLVSAADGTHLWSHAYDRRLDDALAVQEEIAQAIAGSLRLTLARGASPVSRHSANAEAYADYLKGRYALGQRVPGTVRQALDYFGQAIARDSTYALAWVGLAQAYVGLLDATAADRDTILPRAQAAAERALALDSTLAEAYGLLGDIHTDRWEWDAARRAFERALALDDRQPTVLIQYSRFLDDMGRFAEALDVTRRAEELDPLSPSASYNYAGSFLHLGRPEPAIAVARRLIALHPNLPAGYDALGWALVDAGRPAEAIAPLERAVSMGEGRWLALANLGRAYAAVGRRDEAHEVLARLERQWGNLGFGNFAMAAVHVALGERSPALQRIERVYRLRQAKLPHVRQWSAFEPLYGDTAFSRIVRAAGYVPPARVAR